MFGAKADKVRLVEIIDVLLSLEFEELLCVLDVTFAHEALVAVRSFQCLYVVAVGGAICSLFAFLTAFGNLAHRTARGMAGYGCNCSNCHISHQGKFARLCRSGNDLSKGYCPCSMASFQCRGVGPEPK